MQTPNPETFVDEHGVRWQWNAATRSYDIIPANSYWKNDIGHATGGDNALFNSDQNPLGNWEKTKNPLDEGVVASSGGDYNGFSTWETKEAWDWILENPEPFMEAVREGSYPVHIELLFDQTHPQMRQMWEEYGGSFTEVDWVEIWQMIRTYIKSNDVYEDQSSSGLAIPRYMENPIYPMDQQGPDEAEDMIRGAKTAGFQQGQDVLYTPQGGSIGDPTPHPAKITWIGNDGTVEIQFEEGRVLQLPAPTAEMSLTPMGNQADYYPYAPTTPEGMADEADSMVRNATYTDTLQTPEPLDRTEMVEPAQTEMHPPDCPCSQCKFRKEMEEQPVQNHSWLPFAEREPHRNRMKYDDSFPSMISKTHDAGMFDPLDANSRVSWFQHPDTGAYHIGQPGVGHGSIPEYMELAQNPKENIPRISKEGDFINGELRSVDPLNPEEEFQLKQQYNSHRLKYPNLPPLTSEYPADFNQEFNPMPQIGWRQLLPFVHGSEMSDIKPPYQWNHIFDKFAWEDAQPDLSSCPDCASPMTDKQGERVCHSCGSRQPIIYAKEKDAGLIGDIAGGAALAAPWLLGPEVGAPADAAMMGAEGGGLAAGEAAAGGGLGGLMDSAMGKGKSFLQFQGLKDMLGGGNDGSGGGGGGQPQQAQMPAVGTISHTAASDADTDVGNVHDVTGQDVNPNIHSTDGLTNRAGDDPSHTKNHEIGTSSEGLDVLQQTFQEIMEHVMKFLDPNVEGKSDPVMNALDQLFEAHKPGYRNGQSDATLTIEAPSAVGEGEEQAKESKVSADLHAQLTQLVDSWIANQIDDGTLEAGLHQLKTQLEVSPNAMGTPQANPMGNPLEGQMGSQGGQFTANLPMVPQQPGGSVPVAQTPGTNDLGPCEVCGDSGHTTAMHNTVVGNALAQPPTAVPQPESTGNATGMSGPCPYCGGAHSAEMHGVATPSGDMMHNVAAQKESRRPKMCPYHSDIVDYSLTFQDPVMALQTLTPQTYGSRWCKSPEWRGGGCSFTPEMVKQEFWDTREQELKDRRLERQLQEVPQQQETPINQDSDTSLDTPIDSGGYTPTEISDVSAVGAPMEAMASVRLAWNDEGGQPLIEGQSYQMKSPKYTIPEKVTIDRITPNKIDVTIHTDYGMSYKDEIDPKVLESYQYSFVPDPRPDHQPEHKEFNQETNNEYPFYDDTGGQNDLSDLPTPVSHSETPNPSEGLEYLLEGTQDNGQFDGVDPVTLAKVAGRDFSQQEQAAFINEAGHARNIEALNLEGTHYGPISEYRDLDDEIALW